MRTIKFRAWNADNVVMYPLLSVSFDAGTCEVDGDGLGSTQRDENRATPEAILMQFTGLKDENGKEIYEGDVVRHRFEDYEDYDLYRV